MTMIAKRLVWAGGGMAAVALVVAGVSLPWRGEAAAATNAAKTHNVPLPVVSTPDERPPKPHVDQPTGKDVGKPAPRPPATSTGTGNHPPVSPAPGKSKRPTPPVG